MELVKTAVHKRFQADGKSFIFLTPMGTVFELDGDMQAILDHDLMKGSFTQKEFYSRLKGTREEKNGWWATLTKNRVFVPHSVAGNGALNRDMHGKGQIPLKTLVLHVTQACNLGCHYCYHNPEDERGTTPFFAPAHEH